MVWEVWRVVLARIATLHEIETHWSLCDLADANDALDIQEESERDAQAAAKMRERGGRK